MEPITTTAIITTLTSILTNIVSNRLDAKAAAPMLDGFFKRIQGGGAIVNHDLRKALKSAFLLALQSLLHKCLEELPEKQIVRGTTIYPRGHEEQLIWVEGKLEKLAKLLKAVDQDPEIAIQQNDIKFLLKPEGELAENAILAVQAKLSQVATELIKDRPDEIIPACFGDLAKPEVLFEQVNQFFLEKLKEDKKAETAFVVGFLAQIDTRLQELMAQIMQSQPRPSLPTFSYNRALIENKTKEFVGREEVFLAIENFLTDGNQNCGYFIIEAKPGIGKSTILAEYVRRTGCVQHFNVQSTGKNSTALFLEKVCTQLIEKYQLDYKSLPPEATRDSDFLEKLLSEVSQKLGQERLVIAVDALDEVDLSSQKPNMNVLYLPKHLDKNVYFILTQRPLKDKPLPFLVEAPQKVFELKADSAENKQDIKKYLEQRVAKSSALAGWIAGQNLSVEGFVTQLAEKSEYNFMYLFYVLPEIEKGAYKSLTINSLPKGLFQYYYQHWQGMKIDDDSQRQLKINTIYILVELGEPVSAELIADVVGKSTGKVRGILRQWEQFLSQGEKDGQKCYSVYHASFRDFLHNEETLEEANISREDIERRITNNLVKGIKK
jgi:hypothetical protein